MVAFERSKAEGAKAFSWFDEKAQLEIYEERDIDDYTQRKADVVEKEEEEEAEEEEAEAEAEGEGEAEAEAAEVEVFCFFSFGKRK